MEYHGIYGTFSFAKSDGLQLTLAIRKVAPYDKYDEVEFDVPVGKNGDCCKLY